MELNPEIAYYVIRFDRNLMTETEVRAQGHLLITLKATMGRSDEPAQHEAREDKFYYRMLSNDPNVLRLTRAGDFTAATFVRFWSSKCRFDKLPQSV